GRGPRHGLPARDRRPHDPGGADQGTGRSPPGALRSHKAVPGRAGRAGDAGEDDGDTHGIVLDPYSARRTFTGSSRGARYAGNRLSSSATRASVAQTPARVSGSDALTPKTSVPMTRADASAATIPAAMPTSACDMPSRITSRTTSPPRAPRAVLTPISRLRPRTM